MAKTKKPIKTKEPVRLRTKKLANGNQSIYLDFYRDGQRQYEFLKLYLIPEQSPFDKMQNAETLKSANAIKAQRIIELANGAAGLQNERKSKMLLLDWFNIYRESLTGESSLKITAKVAKLLCDYAGEKTRLCDVDKSFVKGFGDYLCNEYRTTKGEKLNPNTAKQYFDYLGFAMKLAFKRELIDKNPFDRLERGDKPKEVETRKCYLEIREVQDLINARCGNEQVKRAFLFSCFCGLRISDIRNLTWGQINTRERKMFLKIKKTGVLSDKPLSQTALDWLPKREGAKSDDSVFQLPVITCVEEDIKNWTNRAGISKHVTFHTARHTWATMLLTNGVDPMTLQEMGDWKTAKMVHHYADITNAKKVEAANSIDGIFNY